LAVIVTIVVVVVAVVEWVTVGSMILDSNVDRRADDDEGYKVGVVSK